MYSLLICIVYLFIFCDFILAGRDEASRVRRRLGTHEKHRCLRTKSLIIGFGDIIINDVCDKHEQANQIDFIRIMVVSQIFLWYISIVRSRAGAHLLTFRSFLFGEELS